MLATRMRQKDVEFYFVSYPAEDLLRKVRFVTRFYGEMIPPGSMVLDLMTSWVSHLPADLKLAGVAGVGMNAVELEHNPVLTERVVQDLNKDPALPWDEGTFDAASGTLGERELFARFAPRGADQPLETYGGRPDGAAVDVEGGYWVAMMEGQQLLRLSPSGEVLTRVELPVRCATMPTFGGADLRTIFVTTAREKRSEAELAAQPWAGCVLKMRVPVAGLPVQFARWPG